jgi:hypothetical protein
MCVCRWGVYTLRRIRYVCVCLCVREREEREREKERENEIGVDRRSTPLWRRSLGLSACLLFLGGRHQGIETWGTSRSCFVRKRKTTFAGGVSPRPFSDGVENMWRVCWKKWRKPCVPSHSITLDVIKLTKICKRAKKLPGKTHKIPAFWLRWPIKGSVQPCATLKLCPKKVDNPPLLPWEPCGYKRG